MKKDKIMEEALRMSITALVKDKIERQDREGKWTKGVTKKEKIAWIKGVYLPEILTNLEFVKIKIRGKIKEM